jgi:hypothetical protein
MDNLHCIEFVSFPKGLDGQLGVGGKKVDFKPLPTLVSNLSTASMLLFVVIVVV